MGSEGSRLGLSLARWGFAGRSERATADAFATIALAADAGVRLVQCASAPGAGIAMLGEVLPREPAMRVMLRLADDDAPETLVSAVQSTLDSLGRKRLDGLVVRAAAVADQPQTWDALRRLKDEGKVAAVGLSACVCDDPAGLARRLRPDFMQLPLGLFDQRLVVTGALQAIAAQGVEIHLRPLATSSLHVAAAPAVMPFPPQVSRLQAMLREAGASPLEATLAFALSRPEASRIVAGVAGASELRTVLLSAATASRLNLDWAALRSDAGCGAALERCVAA